MFFSIVLILAVVLSPTNNSIMLRLGILNQPSFFIVVLFSIVLQCSKPVFNYLHPYQFNEQPMVSMIHPFAMFPDGSNLNPSLQQQRRQQLEELGQENNHNNNNVYTSSNLYQDDSSSSYPSILSRGMMFQETQQPVAVDGTKGDVCAAGFVEHCLILANNDGERRLLATMVANQTAFESTPSEYETLTKEFNGMCHVVIRFIDCLNEHYLKCSPISRQQHQQDTKDMFAESWTSLCAPDGQVRKSKCVCEKEI